MPWQWPPRHRSRGGGGCGGVGLSAFLGVQEAAAPVPHDAGAVAVDVEGDNRVVEPRAVVVQEQESIHEGVREAGEV